MLQRIKARKNDLVLSKRLRLPSALAQISNRLAPEEI
jgi:hypothetical protein